MPSYRYEFVVNGKVDYTCYTEGGVRMYQCILDFGGIDYEVIRTSIGVTKNYK